ncbi:hormogonium polysaccharide secretion pseudopilin HpsC [Calothrix sp. UHCC 0171]|uniref:hormogonium polysaccharide secretion pseudopilin HpsC n=1 Tax=Calothrix sp. UHCC 0171 TaxID=3110245 RepID=UPI002B214A75|nr:hormogonium polysaccharide secretion pseudopilin HpsC [Calothrix sp. UHCC 0171]MEA5569495.1 hormogonium polysaccharide secretion pseudopilin HpsC [Calothrix sp. UHCC 0171]
MSTIEDCHFSKLQFVWVKTKKEKHSMKHILIYLFKERTQHNQSVPLQQGFTLIELLVAMIVATLVITPLLTFMINILDTDRREQAKTSSEQEVQGALDYIAQDMEQAIYIYDADGIYGKTDPTDSTKNITGIINQLPNPTDTTKVPVLVFWKRYFLDNNQNVTVNNQQQRVGCLVKLSGNICNNQDYMLYSLVAYYLVKDNNPTWNSTTARIERWEIRDGIRDEGGSITRTETINGTTKSVKYLLPPSPGFMPFNLSLEGDLKKKLGTWTKHSESYNLTINKQIPLIDFIDQTTTVQGAPPPACNPDEQQIPRYSGTNSAPTALQTGSFYVCVNSSKYVAQVFIRGNAKARFVSGAEYQSNQSEYFPTASIQIKARGFLGVN